MIEIIPAIDLIAGKCVRLKQGDFNHQTEYPHTPLEMAKNIANAGFKKLHLVDLDGAKSAKPQNIKILKQIAENTDLTIDFGGGIKSILNAEEVISAGAAQINLGSICVKNSEQAKSIIDAVGADRVIITADVMAGEIMLNAWQDKSGVKLLDLIRQYKKLGVNNFLCTNIALDGTLQGVETDFYKIILESFPDIYLVASGGVANLDDFKKLDDINVPAVVVGKAWHEGIITIRQMREYAS